jgi:hypothetical protein
LWVMDFFACVDFQHKEDQDNYKIEVQLLVRCNTKKWGINWWMDEWMNDWRLGNMEWMNWWYASLKAYCYDPNNSGQT